MHLAIWPWKT